MKYQSKKYICIILICSVILCVTSIVSAGQSEKDQFDRCICGREYFHDTTQSHAKYDCTKCGKPLSDCECNCWCGADTEASDIIVGQIHLRLCKNCGKFCTECICADYEAMLNLEKMQSEGTVAIDKIPISQSTSVMTLSFILILITMLCFVLVLSGNKLHKTKNNQRKALIQQTTHSKILDKIETQVDKKAEDEVHEGEFDISKFPVSWKQNIGTSALAAYVLTNTLNVQQDTLPPTAVNLIEYTVDYIQSAVNGKYGKYLQPIQANEEFIHIAKNSISNSISGYEADAQQLQQLQQLAYKADVKAAGAVTSLSELKSLLDEEYIGESTRVIKHNSRFPGGKN